MNNLEQLEKSGFVVTSRKKQNRLSDEILERYKNIPVIYINFLHSFETIINKAEDAWFNSIEDFNEESDSAFKWNDFELQSLEAFEDDEEETEKILKF